MPHEKSDSLAELFDAMKNLARTATEKSEKIVAGAEKIVNRSKANSESDTEKEGTPEK